MGRDKGRVYAVVNHGPQALEVAEGLGRIHYDNLREELEYIDAETTWWGTVHANVKRRANEAKAHMEVVRAQLRNLIRQTAAAGQLPGTGRSGGPTVDAVNDGVILHPDFQVAQQAYFVAEEQADIAETAKFATIRKSDSLRLLGHLVLQEEMARRFPSSAAAPAIETTPKRQAYTGKPGRR